MKNSLKKIFASLFAGLLVLSACGGGAGEVDTKFPLEVTNNDKSVEGGILKYGIVSDSALPGVYNTVFYSSQPDSSVLQFVQPTLFNYTDEFEIDTEKPGLASIKFADDLLSLEVEINKDLNWDDGVPVTAEDYAFAFEVIGRKDYQAEKGIRYSGSTPLIVGMEEYHEGKTNTISGIEIVNEKKVKISFIEPSLSMKANFWSYPMAKHIFGGMTAKEIVASDSTRTKIVGYGPFSVEKVIPGESVKLVRNEGYLHGPAKLEGVEIKAVQTATVDEALASGELDMLDSFPANKYEPGAMPSNVEVLGQMETSISYLGFKLGSWNSEKSENIPNPDAKMADVKLRQAMGYAMDNAAVGESLYNGLRVQATSIVVPRFTNYFDDKVKGFTYDPDKANALLDEAGYVDVDGDGFRETPTGEKLVINYAAMEGSAAAEPHTKFNMQKWAEVGLNVQLLEGRLQDFNVFYEKIQEDDPKIDIYEAAWITGFDQNPANLWGPDSFSNFTRYQSEKGNTIIDDISSEKSIFDAAYRKEQYDAWQVYFEEEAQAIPTMYRYEVLPINKRIKNFGITPSKSQTPQLWAELEVTADEPIKA